MALSCIFVGASQPRQSWCAGRDLGQNSLCHCVYTGQNRGQAKLQSPIILRGGGQPQKHGGHPGATGIYRADHQMGDEKGTQKDPCFWYSLCVSRLHMCKQIQWSGCCGIHKSGKKELVGQGQRAFFPEGTRSRGNLLPFKKGAFVFAMNSGRPVLPITIKNSEHILPWYPCPHAGYGGSDHPPPSVYS